MTTHAIGERRDNLPVKVTRFVGRKPELAAISEAIGAHRLVTLRGPGGVGKTRLALQAAAAIRDAYGQRTWLVELSGLRDPELVPREVAMSFGLPDEGAADPRQAFARQIAESELLLILDTCEHVTGACAELAGMLLENCPDLRILATSRESLGVPGEVVVPIAPLDASAPTSEAVELFLDRARAAVPGYLMTTVNADALVRLCQKLDGIPLAIELAAVRLRSMTAEEIVDRLDDRFRILGTARTALDRHRTLRAAVDWSYGLCSAQEQRAWTRLSVFPGEFSAEAATAVCGPGTMGTLARLADKSIVIPAPDTASPAPPSAPPSAPATPPARYRLLDTMREFGADLLAARDRADARRAHRDYFLALAQTAAAHSGDHEQVGWMAWVQEESASLRAALDFSYQTPGEAEAGARLTLALRRYWLMLGTFTEAMRWHELAMAATRGTPLEAWATYGAVLLAAQQGRLATAGPLLERAAAAAREPGDADLAAYVADAQGCVAFYGGDNDTASERFEAALAHFEAAGLRDSTALVCYTRLASACLIAFDLDRAISLCDECMRRCAQADEQWAASTAIWVRGAARWLSGDIGSGLADALACLAIKHALGDRHTATMSIDLIAVCLASRGGPGDFARSATLGGAGDAMWEVLNAPLQMGPVYAEIRKDAAAKCRAALGDEIFEAAQRHGLSMTLDEAIALARGEAPPPAEPGPKPLTRREREIAVLVARGLGNREIAERLFLSKRTVDSHIEHIFAKLSLTSRTQLTNWLHTQNHP